jgi:hypothetical protein
MPRDPYTGEEVGGGTAVAVDPYTGEPEQAVDPYTGEAEPSLALTPETIGLGLVKSAEGLITATIPKGVRQAQQLVDDRIIGTLANLSETDRAEEALLQRILQGEDIGGVTGRVGMTDQWPLRRISGRNPTAVGLPRKSGVGLPSYQATLRTSRT